MHSSYASCRSIGGCKPWHGNDIVWLYRFVQGHESHDTSHFWIRMSRHGSDLKYGFILWILCTDTVSKLQTWSIMGAVCRAHVVLLKDVSCKYLGRHVSLRACLVHPSFIQLLFVLAIAHIFTEAYCAEGVFDSLTPWAHDVHAVQNARFVLLHSSFDMTMHHITMWCIICADCHVIPHSQSLYGGRPASCDMHTETGDCLHALGKKIPVRNNWIHRVTNHGEHGHQEVR